MRNRNVSDRASRATLVGAVAAAFAASACCLLPALLAVVGLSGVGFAAAVAQYRLPLLGVSGALLAGGFYLLYLRPAHVAGSARGQSDACECPVPNTNRTGRLLLWIAAAAVFLFAAFPYISAANARTEAEGDATSSAELEAVHLGISGMTCEACTTTITETLAAVPGVARVRVSFDDSTAQVSYDSGRVTASDLASVVSALDGYEARVSSHEANR